MQVVVNVEFVCFFLCFQHNYLLYFYFLEENDPESCITVSQCRSRNTSLFFFSSPVKAKGGAPPSVF